MCAISVSGQTVWKRSRLSADLSAEALATVEARRAKVETTGRVDVFPVNANKSSTYYV
jgi:hypothetical protein